MGRKERERKSVRQTNRQLDRDSQIVVHVIAIKQILHTHTHFHREMEEEKMKPEVQPLLFRVV